MRPPAFQRTSVGLSLVELMIAMVIGLVLLLGLMQVFAASRTASRLSEGLARVQENGRFAMDFLQRDLRMAGHFGCVNDQSHNTRNPGSLHTTFAAAGHPALDFAQSIQGFEAIDTKPGDPLTLTATPTTGSVDYSPALPSEYADALTNRVDGSDIVALRFLVPDGVPVTAITGTDDKPGFSFDSTRWAVLQSGVKEPGLFGVADCTSATLFQASAVSGTGGSVTFNTAPNNTTSFTSIYTAGQAVLYRAESVVYYIGYDATTRQSSLYRVRFSAKPGEALVAEAPEALVEGVRNMQLLYGQDHSLSATAAPSGFIDRQGTAADVQDSLAPADAAWRRVGAVQLGLLLESPDPSAAAQATADAALTAVGVTFTTPRDGRFRTVYQTTIAVRNRLYGN